MAENREFKKMGFWRIWACDEFIVTSFPDKNFKEKMPKKDEDAVVCRILRGEPGHGIIIWKRARIKK